MNRSNTYHLVVVVWTARIAVVAFVDVGWMLAVDGDETRTFWLVTVVVWSYLVAAVAANDVVDDGVAVNIVHKPIPSMRLSLQFQR